MTNLTLVSHHLCPYVQRAVITLTEKSTPFQRIDIDLGQKPDWFRAISPLGKVPLLRIGETVLFESAAICEFIDETIPAPLHPAEPVERARHRGWVEYASTLLGDISAFYNAKRPDHFQDRRDILIRRFDWLERQLGAGPYFAGARFSLVDAAFAPIFRYYDTFEATIGLTDLAPFDRIADWRTALAARPSVQNAVSTDYPQSLATFLKGRDSHLATLVGRKPA